MYNEIFFYLWLNANQEIYHVQLFHTHKHRIRFDFLMCLHAFCTLGLLAIASNHNNGTTNSMNLKFDACSQAHKFALCPLLLSMHFIFVQKLRCCSQFTHSSCFLFSHEKTHDSHEFQILSSDLMKLLNIHSF